MIKQSILITLFSLVFCQLTFATIIKVGNNIQLAAANKSAVAGDTIVLKNCTWADCNIVLTCNGTATKPILVTAEEAGKVIITGRSNLRIGGNYVIVSGLEFRNGYASEGDVWQFKAGKTVANNCRITNCTIYDFSNLKRLDENYWVAFYGQHNRIDHCTFYDKKNIGVLMAVILDDDRSRLNSHSIDSNNFAGRTPLASNGGEIIRVGVSQHCTFYSNTVIKDNVFDNCDGEAEIISIKSCGNVIRNNVFKECQGSLSLRHGNNNTVEGNIFLGNGKEGTGGVRIINEGNWVINNLFYECRGVNFRSPLAIMNGVFNSPAFRYLPVRDAVVANNTFINCASFNLCEGSDAERTVPPKNVYFFNNVFLNKKDTTLYEVFAKIDSIYFFNNIADNSLKQTLIKGFSKRDLSFASLQSTPLTINITNNKALDSIRKLAATRLAYGLPKTIGFTRWAAYKNVTKDLFTGKGYKLRVASEWTVYPSNDMSIKCATAADIYKALELKKNIINIELTSTEYEFYNPIIISKSVSFSGPPTSLVRLKSSSSLPAIFIVNGGGSLTLNYLLLDGSATTTNNFIASDTSGGSNHFTMHIDQCYFMNFDKKNGCNSFYNAYKYSVADYINITGCTFINNNFNIFSLKDETDNKGYYNVENMSISYCNFFNNNNGNILNLYRGGNDESTMGPKLTFNNNTITNCNHSNALIELTGVQQSYFTNNHFINTNTSKTIIRYTDKVRALHQQQNNQLTNSGSISENKFVVNKR